MEQCFDFFNHKNFFSLIWSVKNNFIFLYYHMASNVKFESLYIRTCFSISKLHVNYSVICIISFIYVSSNLSIYTFFGTAFTYL